MDHLREPVEHGQDGVVALGGREAGNKVKGNVRLWSTGDGKRAEESGWETMGGPHVLGARAVGEGKIEPAEEQGPARLSRSQPLGVSDVSKVLVISPNHYGLLDPLHPMAPLGEGGVDSQELPIPHVIIRLRRGKPAGQKGDKMDVLILFRPLGEDGPDAYIRCVHLHDELVRGLGKDEHRGRGEQALQDREGVLGLWGPGEGTEG